jgi:hypothetical protein
MNFSAKVAISGCAQYESAMPEINNTPPLMMRVARASVNSVPLRCVQRGAH